MDSSRVNAASNPEDDDADDDGEDVDDSGATQTASMSRAAGVARLTGDVMGLFAGVLDTP